MQNNMVETLIAALVVAVAVGFLSFAYNSTHSGSFSTYHIPVAMTAVDGLKNDADVRIHGIKVGSVTAIGLDPKTYVAHVDIAIRDDVHVPVDSTLRVASGVVGSNYLSILPGNSVKKIAADQLWQQR
jgi:phospholipid/cholesterol/gamma-HCH transport system substrate-binding protein